MKKNFAVFLIMALVIASAVFFYVLKEKYADNLSAEKENMQKEVLAGKQANEKDGDIAVETVPVDVEKSDTADIVYSYPVFSGMKDTVAETKINADIKNKIMKEAEEKQGVTIKAMCGINSQPSVSEGNQCKYTYDAKYKSFSQYPGRILSVRVETYIYAGGAHGSTVVEFINYNLHTGERMDWRSVFAQSANYLELISEHARPELRKQLIGKESSSGDEDWIKEGSAANEDNYDGNCVGFDNDRIIVVYPEYQVAAYAVGPVTVTIPYSDLKDAINSEEILKN